MKVAERGRGLARTSPLVGMTANVVAQTQHEVRLDTVGNAECSVRTGKFKAPEGIPRPNGEDACGGSGNGRGGDGTGKRFKFKTKVEPFLYPYIKSVFQIATKTFYRALWVDGLHNIPPEGVPTLLAFNHGNGLGDPAVVMSCCPRMVRFVAKDTIFMDKNFGTLIAESGAIPIERRREWGDEANNLQAFNAVFEALELGQCLGIAPEGLSRFHPNLAPLKTGTARIAVEMCRRHKDNRDYTIAILPCSLTYLHREKWRSDVLVTFSEPIMVTPKDLPDVGSEAEGAAGAEVASDVANGKRDKEDETKGKLRVRNEQDYLLAHRLTERLRAALTRHTLHCTEWRQIRLATTACRLIKPYGCRITLTEYISTVRYYLDKFDGGDSRQKVVETCALLQKYRDALHAHSLSDEDIARVSQRRQRRIVDSFGNVRSRPTRPQSRRRMGRRGGGNKRRKGTSSGAHGLIADIVSASSTQDRGSRPGPGLLFRLMLSLALGIPIMILTLPGLALWSPVMVFMRVKQKRILQRRGGIEQNADELAELKMLYTTLYFLSLCVGIFCFGATGILENFVPRFGPMRPPSTLLESAGLAFICIPFVFFYSVPLFEISITLLREVRSGSNLFVLTTLACTDANRKEMDKLLRLREGCLAGVRALGLPSNRREGAENRNGAFSVTTGAVAEADVAAGCCEDLTLLRRKDWNFTLRLEDEHKDPFH